MAFPESKVKICFDYEKGRCECRREHSFHKGERCNQQLVWENRGRTGSGAWEAHHKDGDSNNDSITNCEILCWDCHALTL